MKEIDITNMSKKEILEYRIAERMKGKKGIDLIKFYYETDIPFELPAPEEAKRKRMAWMWNLMAKGHPTIKVVKKFTKVWGMSESAAWRHLKHTREIFGEISKIDILAEKQVTMEMAKEDYRAAVKDNDLPSRIKAVSNLIKLGAFDQIDPNRPDLDKMKAIYTIVLDDSIRERMLKMTSDPVMDLSNMLDKMNPEDAQLENQDNPGAD